jgi:hypothetical protein
MVIPRRQRCKLQEIIQWAGATRPVLVFTVGTDLIVQPFNIGIHQRAFDSVANIHKRSDVTFDTTRFAKRAAWWSFWQFFNAPAAN